MPKTTEKKAYAYLLLDVLYDVADGVDVGGYVNPEPPTAGDIIIRETNHGTNSVSIRIPDGPITWTCTAVYVGTGRIGDDEQVQFADIGVLCLLNLIKIGWDAETTLKLQVHEVIDGVKALVEEWHGEDPDFDRLTGKIDTYEKNLWRKH